MPYAPTVDDRSGEIFMGGVLQGASALGRGLESAGKQWRENDAKNTASKSYIAATLAKNPELLKGLSEKDQKLALKFQDGNTGLKDNTYFAGLLTTAQQQQQDAQNQKLRDMQMQDAQRKQEAAQRLQQMGQMQGQLDRGVGGGVFSRQTQQQLENPLMKFASTIQQVTGAPPSDAVMGDYAERLAARKDAKAPMPAPEFMKGPNGETIAFVRGSSNFQNLTLPQSPEDKGKFPAGKTKDFTYNGVKRKGEWDGKEWRDIENNAPMTVTQRDRWGQVVADGFPNPVLFGAGGKKTGKPDTPWGKEEPTGPEEPPPLLAKPDEKAAGRKPGWYKDKAGNRGYWNGTAWSAQ
jgi:hypothetical protein